ncbi:rhodanese-like domain-containing protein [Abyssisolibacter fermentans]|uniref:rhodanese-like domain-containing protein n=1 Tax=Abyssisolibacter fermentans TaxID=1766203 RepID=UPI00083046AB|nr:rhodanese-like domain-containing protein [Abyssisolibacter fermentans]
MTSINQAVAKYFEDCEKGCNNLISCESLNEKIKQNPKDLFVLDIRKEEDFKKGHVDGAVNIFWYDVGECIDVLPKDKKIIVICYSGQSAGQIVSLLKLLGYDACSLKGGMLNGWVKNSLPVKEGC